MDLVYSTRIVDDLKQQVTAAQQRDGSDFWIVLAATLAGAAATILLLDPASLGAVIKMATHIG